MKALFQPTWQSLITVLFLITVIWSLSSYGYYVVVDLLDAPGGYNDRPRAFSFYYAAWSLVAFAVFHPSISAWAQRASPREDRIVLAVVLASFVAFSVGVLPALPEVDVPQDLSVENIVVAQPWYFLPKTVEILFQQILMTALILVLAAQNLSLRRIAVVTAILFGGFHLTLALSGANPFYVTRYTIAATLFGAVVPYQMLRMENGFIYAFSLHWGWYALDTTVGHFVLSAA